MHRLPRPHLVPLCIHTPAVRRWLAETYDAMSGEEKTRALAFRELCDVRLDRERPWRIANQRLRLYACHWAGWRPERTSTRWGATGRKWLLSHGPRIDRARATSSEPRR